MRGPWWLVPLPGSRSYRPAGRPVEKMAVAGSGWGLAQVAEALGSSEQALRLIVSILMGEGEQRARQLGVTGLAPQEGSPARRGAGRPRRSAAVPRCAEAGTGQRREAPCRREAAPVSARLCQATCAHGAGGRARPATARPGPTQPGRWRVVCVRLVPRRGGEFGTWLAVATGVGARGDPPALPGERGNLL